MANRCPKCEVKGFTWSVDEERGSLTYWDCTACSYEATEDESHEK
ncbi:unnamed protein product, partial [Ectocarpus sp. 4 AP-2014]